MPLTYLILNYFITIHRPRTGETVPHPDVVRAKLLRRRIPEQGGANNAEKADVVDHFLTVVVKMKKLTMNVMVRLRRATSIQASTDTNFCKASFFYL